MKMKGAQPPLADLVLKSQLMIWLCDMILEYFTTNTGYTANLTINLVIFFCCKTIAKAIISHLHHQQINRRGYFHFNFTKNMEVQLSPSKISFLHL